MLGGGSLFPLSLGSVRWGTGLGVQTQGGQPGSVNSLEPWEELRAAFWFVVAVWVQS